MKGKVVLFFPSYYSDEAAPPLALIHLAAPLVDHGYDVRIIDSAVSDGQRGRGGRASARTRSAWASAWSRGR